MPWCSDSWPSVGLTVCTDWRVSSTGRAPAFSMVARSLASCSVNPPVITPVPPVIGLCDAGRRDDLTVDHDRDLVLGRRQRDGLRGGLAEGVGAAAVQLELDGPLRGDLRLGAARQDRGGLRHVAAADDHGTQPVLRAVAGSFDCPRYTTSLSWSAWNEQSFVARSSGSGAGHRGRGVRRVRRDR